jgi:hypothetical protein
MNYTTHIATSYRNNASYIYCHKISFKQSSRQKSSYVMWMFMSNIYSFAEPLAQNIETILKLIAPLYCYKTWEILFFTNNLGSRF